MYPTKKVLETVILSVRVARCSMSLGFFLLAKSRVEYIVRAHKQNKCQVVVKSELHGRKKVIGLTSASIWLK